MRKLLVLAALAAVPAGAWLACQPGDREVVVTREQFGDAWPLEVNSAKVVCTADAEAAYVRLGRKLYGFDEAAESEGYPSIQEVVRQVPVDPERPEVGSWPADPRPLAEACDTPPGDVASSH